MQACWRQGCEFSGAAATHGLCSAHFDAAHVPGSLFAVHPFSWRGPLRANASLRVALAPGAEGALQWRKDGAPLPRAQQPRLLLRSVGAADAGEYTCELQLPDGRREESRPATVALDAGSEARVQEKERLLALVDEALASGDWRAVLTAAGAAAQTDPQDDAWLARVELRRGRALVALRRLREALRAFAAACELAPGCVEAWLAHARAARSEGRYRVSFDSFQEAARLGASVGAEAEEVEEMLRELRAGAGSVRPDEAAAGPPPPAEEWRSYRRRWEAAPEEERRQAEEARQRRAREAWEEFRRQRESFGGSGGSGGAAGAGAGAGGQRAEWLRALELDESASQADIKRAYRRLALRWHPDKVAQGGATPEELAEATARFQEVSAAADGLLF